VPNSTREFLERWIGRKSEKASTFGWEKIDQS
jgi:hypothetical protein